MTDVPMANTAALTFLQTRRSHLAKTLGDPGPDQETLTAMLTAAARVPDHKMLIPWRFIVIQGETRARLAEAIAARAVDKGLDAAAVDKAQGAFLMGPLCVAVVATPKEAPAFPEVEQVLSAGAVCAALVNAALASGFGAQWLTDWRAYDRPFLEQTLGLTPRESVAGYIHIGTATLTPTERPRPDLRDIVEWL